MPIERAICTDSHLRIERFHTVHCPLLVESDNSRRIISRIYRCLRIELSWRGTIDSEGLYALGIRHEDEIVLRTHCHSNVSTACGKGRIGNWRNQAAVCDRERSNIIGTSVRDIEEATG